MSVPTSKKFDEREYAITFADFCRIIGRRTRQQRCIRRMTIDDLATASGIPAGELREIENGAADLPLSCVWRLSLTLDHWPEHFLASSDKYLRDYPEPEVVESVAAQLRSHIAEERAISKQFGKKKFWSQVISVGGTLHQGKFLWGVAFDNSTCSSDEFSEIAELAGRVCNANAQTAVA